MQKICKILTNKFNVTDPKSFIQEIKKTGYVTKNYRFLENIFLELPPEKFNQKIILKLVKFVSEYKKSKISLSYEPMYWSLRKNIPLDESQKIVDDYNQTNQLLKMDL